MAVTVEKIIEYKGEVQLTGYAVASGQTIYKGTLAGVVNGYLENLSSSNINQVSKVVYVADGSANTSGPAATTSAGSISGSLEQGSADAGDKTIRLCYEEGVFKATFTSITQAMVGQPVFASDNYTIDDSQAGAVEVGYLQTYISATSGWFVLNGQSNHSGTTFYTAAIAASSGNAGLFSIVNPLGATAIIEKLALDITTGSSLAGTIDVGVTTAAASADTVIDGVTSSLTGVFNNYDDAGTNGNGVIKMTSAQYITGTHSGAPGTLAGSVLVWARVLK